MAPATPSLKPKTLTPSWTSPYPSLPAFSPSSSRHSHLESLPWIYSVLSFPPAQPWLRTPSGLSGHLPLSPSSVPSQDLSIFCLKKSCIWNALPWFSTQPRDWACTVHVDYHTPITWLIMHWSCDCPGILDGWSTCIFVWWTSYLIAGVGIHYAETLVFEQHLNVTFWSVSGLWAVILMSLFGLWVTVGWILGVC